MPGAEHSASNRDRGSPIFYACRNPSILWHIWLFPCYCDRETIQRFQVRSADGIESPRRLPTPERTWRRNRQSSAVIRVSFRVNWILIFPAYAETSSVDSHQPLRGANSSDLRVLVLSISLGHNGVAAGFIQSLQAPGEYLPRCCLAAACPPEPSATFIIRRNPS